MEPERRRRSAAHRRATSSIGRLPRGRLRAGALAVGDYAREVLDEAYRRGFRDNGIRMQQLGECGAERELITERFAALRDELADLSRRAEAAAKPGWWQP